MGVERDGNRADVQMFAGNFRRTFAEQCTSP